MSAATARRLFCTLRSALNAAARERLIPDNPARYLKLPTGRRPFAVVWTPRRVEEWKRTGIRPAVAEFLASIAVRPFAVYRLIAMRGLRRGEACGLRWEDLDLDQGLAGGKRPPGGGGIRRLSAPVLAEIAARPPGTPGNALLAASLKPLPQPADLDQYRIRKRACVGSLINEYRLVA